ncbi:MAG TPA: histidine triad nucleotide-binding protein [Dehalococcoidia bacterium]|nr:histidine triad nucleotide-binding protein [Dehalococcoidia bacterium]
MAVDCLFCEMAAGRITVDRLYDTSEIFAVRDINPRAPIHILVIPKRHIAMVSDLGSDDGNLLADMFVAASEIARSQGLHKSGYRCAFNVGADAGQSVFHIHMHVLGGQKLGPEA